MSEPLAFAELATSRKRERRATGETPVPPTGETPVPPTGETPVPPAGETPVPLVERSPTARG